MNYFKTINNILCFILLMLINEYILFLALNYSKFVYSLCFSEALILLAALLSIVFFLPLFSKSFSITQ